MNLRSCGLLAVLLLLMPGCAADNQPTINADKKVSDTQTVANAAPVELTVATIAELEKLIAEQGGKVVVLDLWALW